MSSSALFNALSSTPSISLSQQFEDFACVALLLREKENGLSLGLIRRAEHPQDPWSGQIGLPGGRCDPGDNSDLHAVLREVREEIGLTLPLEILSQRLHDVQARRAGGLLPFFLRPFVFFLNEEPKLKLDPAEVSAFHWIPLSHFLHSEHHINHNKLPGVRLPSGDVLWGLTYVVLTDFFERLHSHEETRKLYFAEKNFFTLWKKYLK